jgi:Rrf2 family protein
MKAEFLVAAHALAYLNRKKGPVSSAELASSICTNPARIRKIMVKLRKAGLIETQNGKSGGYFLKKPPENITLNEVAAATDEKIVDADWKPGNPHADCLISSGMGQVMDTVLTGLNKTCFSYLAGITIKDIDRKLALLNKEKRTAPK